MFGSNLTRGLSRVESSERSVLEEMQASVMTFPQKNKEGDRDLSLRCGPFSVHGLSMLIIENRLNFLFGKDGCKDLSALGSDWLTCASRADSMISTGKSAGVDRSAIVRVNDYGQNAGT